ncbi:MAG: hypothetical protein J6Y62_01110 [Clostridia bacterium]|nr:hypothetical protein [Clostridia bacterium]
MRKFTVTRAGACDTAGEYDRNRQWTVFDQEGRAMAVTVKPCRYSRYSGLQFVSDEPMEITVKKAGKGGGTFVSLRLARFLESKGYSVRNMK